MAKSQSALEKALLVLETLVGEGQPMASSSLAAHTGLPKATVHRILQQLHGLGLVQRSPRRDHFVVGSRLWDLSAASLAARFAVTPAHAIMEALVAEIRESCNIGILEGGSVRYIDRVECDWPLRLQLQPDDILPAHCVAIGKLLLAAQPLPARQAYLTNATLDRFTPRTITDPTKLGAELERIAVQGYAVNDQEYFELLIGLAVPIRSARGDVIAGLAVHGPLPRMTLERLPALLPVLQKAADKLSACFAGQVAAS